MSKKKKENEYAGQFHAALMWVYREFIAIGTKIHGSIFQKKGMPDYVYCVDNTLLASSFLGIEAKYIPTKKIPKRKGFAIHFDKQLEDHQLTMGKRINAGTGIGLQATFIHISREVVYAVLTRVGQNAILYPPFRENLEGFAALDPEDSAKHHGLLVLKRTPGDKRKVPIDERYPDLAEKFCWVDAL